MRRHTKAAAVAAATFALTAVAAPIPAAGDPPRPSASALHAPARGGALVTRTDYRNPVSRTFADTFADPAVIRGKDGWWYAYGTTDPLREGETTAHRIPIARSRDMVSWRYVGDAFTNANLPRWTAAGGALWAPDIRYVNGQYRMYYVVTQTTVGAAANVNDNAIGMATAPTPVGPWTDSGAPVVGPRPGASGNPDDFLWTFDPHVVSNTDGSQWIFYGSYYGGIHVQRLAANGRTRVGTSTQVAIDNKFEGAYVIRRGGYWYMFASTANCCAGPTTGYSVHVGRSRSITGPYVDREGVRLNQSRAGGTPTLMQNGNRWIGAGHNAVTTDLAGQDWIVYHAIDRADPYLTGTEGINERPMLIDRLDWINGWPYVRAGRGPSEGLRRGPATGGRWVTRFERGVPARWEERGSWAERTDAQAGDFAFARRSGTLLSGAVRSGARVEADLRSRGEAYGLTARLGRTTVRVVVDPDRGTFRLQERRPNRTVRSTTSRLPNNFRPRAWHSVELEIRRGVATASITHARLYDPLATARLAVRRGQRVASAGAFAGGAGVGVDNLSVLPAAHLVTRVVREDVPDRLVRRRSDEFNGGSLRSGWTWVRPDSSATVTGGALRWQVQDKDLVGTGNNASVLLRSPGNGDWTAETKVTIDLGTNEIRNFQQGGLIAYVNDDLFTRLSHVAIFNTRQTEFGKEMPYAGRLSYGGTIVGPPAATTWLRLTHRLDPRNGEHELRAWSSRNGRTWTKGGVWTLPAGTNVRVGLIAHGRQQGATATAQFDYFRLYR